MRPFPLSIITTVLAACLLPACSAIRLDRPLQVASGLTSQFLCAGTFISGLDPDRYYAEAVKPLPGMELAEWALHYDVDRTQRQVTSSLAGMFHSRAVFREGLGCVLEQGDAAADIAGGNEDMPQSLLPPVEDTVAVVPSNPRLQAAVDRAFAEPDGPPFHRTKALVVMHDGKIVAERYAPGYGIETPLPGFSVTKSVTNALVGILVRQGRIALDQPAPLPAWQEAGDPRHAVTVDMLLRQTSGLDFHQTNSGFDPSSRMKFIERDMAGFALTARLDAEPGARWDYTDGNYMLLSRIVRDAAGGRAQHVLQFARRELFDPLGMRHATLQFDATGTPLGAHGMFASARDWARFGMLYLNDGMAGGKRILPEGWVRYSASRTLDTGYGAGFFTNLASGNVPQWGVPWGMSHVPRDTYFARGFMGQFVIVIPSERLVIVRFSISHMQGDDIAFTDRVAADVIAAIREI